jgi:hypothetical protein
MSALPVLVAWGSVISKLVVAALAGGAVLGYRALRNRRDVRAALGDARRMTLSVDEPREGPIAVAGIYHADGWLDCGGQRVVLVGELSIVRGSSATWKRGVRTYALRDGDGVVAIGRMSRRAGADGTDYREAAGGWQLEPSAGELGIQMCLVKPVPCPRPLWPVRGVLVLGIVGVAAYFGLGYAGKKLVEYRHYPREELLEGDGVSTLASQIACALPRSRERALVRYEIDLDYQRQTEDVIAKRVAMARRRDCYAAVLKLKDLGRFEQGVETANDCGHPEYGRGALVALGRYEEASKITTDFAGLYADDPVLAMIAAGHWREAAAHLETQKHRDADGARCLARYLRSVADGKPLEPSGISTSRTCRVLDGVFDNKEDEYEPAVAIARWAFASGPPPTETFGLAEQLSPFATDDSYQTHEMRATLAIDLGQLDVAAAEIERALAGIEPSREDDKSDRRDASLRRRLPVMAALRTGKPFPAFERDPEFSYEEDEAALLRGGTNPNELPRLARASPAVITAITQAQAGDGLLLADLHERATDRLFGIRIDDAYLLALAPLVKTHREELARAVRNRPSRHSGLHELAVERDILRMLGDTKGAERLQAIIDRIAKGLDREKLKALLVAGTLS